MGDPAAPARRRSLPLERLGWVALGVLLLAVALGCQEPANRQDSTPTPTPTVTPAPGTPSPTPAAPTATPLAALPIPPDGDRFEQAQRLMLHSATPIPRVVNPNPVTLDAGRSDTFWVADLDSHRHFQVQATLRHITDHAYWYVDANIDIPQADIEKSAAEFEKHIYPTVTQHFGAPLSPGVDNDPHLTILNTKFRGAAGYYSSADEYPKVMHPFSNEREMIYIDVGTLKPGTPSYHNVLAHELQHAAHWRADPNEASWINEGLSVLAEDIAGFSVGLINAFTTNPDVQLTGWDEEPRLNAPHYAASYLFLKYLAQHYGGYAALNGLVDERGHSTEGVDAFLRQSGFAERFVDVFRDWTVANYVDELGVTDQRYLYPDARVRVQTTRSVTAPASVSGSLHEFAANYIEIKQNSGEAKVTFKGPTVARLLPNAAHSGQFQWWSNRADAADSTLTREFDLTSVSAATLRFWMWHELEKHWDWAYVEASDDGGATWKVLQGAKATTDNPVGSAFGAGYTGASGGGATPEWAEETVDLSAYRGKKVLVRFEAITDEAVNLNGFAIDDISVPEIGFRDDAEQDAGWDTRGWIRHENRVAQSFQVQVIEFSKDITIRSIPLNAANEATFAIQGFGAGLTRAV
ncbi:MAG: immune inhibitor A, partial [Chloroflexi bacterium]|nr:immune inhibitor A [Chloroflexota bacterium]